MTKLYRALGLMSGTSLDGIDIAVIQTDGHRIDWLGPHETATYDDVFRARLRAALTTTQASGRFDEPGLETELTDRHADVVERFASRHPEACQGVDVIGFHGQTVLHRPDQRLTLQIGDGQRLADRTGMTIVCDFRSDDVRAGGQGAPLAPLFHAAMARDLERPVAILNIGGVANVTWIDGEEVIAFDTGPGNALVDDLVRSRTNLPYDTDGRLALLGRPNEDIVARLMANPYFDAAPPKSLDRNNFDARPCEGLRTEDAAATLVAFTVRSIARALEHMPHRPARWLVSGGGRNNPAIMAGLAEVLGAPVESVDRHGWQGDAVEAQAFAFLAVRSLEGLPLSLPGTTGVPRPMPGGRCFEPQTRPAVSAGGKP